MNGIAKRIAPAATAAGLVFGSIALGLGCAKKPDVDPHTGLPVPTHSLFIGQWAGKDRKGDVYSFAFTKGAWESYVDKGGARLLHYRGTYSHDGGSIALRIAEQGDPKTGRWVKEKGNLPDSVSGWLAGSVLRIPALTDADLVKR
jgi:hypothetical protein